MFLINIVFLLSLKLGFTFDLPRKCNSDIRIINDRYNVSETLKLGRDVIPTDAHYDVHGNLFYVESLRDGEGYHFNIFVVKSKSAAPQKIAGLPKDVSYSIAVDAKKTIVYFGTGKGVYTYKYDSLTPTAAPLTNSSLKLDMIFVDKDSNKYIIENVDGIEEFYFLDGETKIRCHSLEALNEMAIDHENNFYFIREEKLFVLKSRHEIPTCIGAVEYNGNAQITFYKNNVFVASDKLFYFHQNDSGNLKLVDNIPEGVSAIAFDRNGEFTLGIQGNLLKYKKNDCYFRKNRVVDEHLINL